MSNSLKTLALAGMFGVSGFLASPAFAHAALVQTNPAPNSTVASPKEIRLTFSEKITPAFSGFGVSMSDGMTVKLTGRVAEDGKTIVGTPTGALMAGTWKVSWHATSTDDGHRTEGSFNFVVK